MEKSNNEGEDQQYQAQNVFSSELQQDAHPSPSNSFLQPVASSSSSSSALPETTPLLPWLEKMSRIQCANDDLRMSLLQSEMKVTVNKLESINDQFSPIFTAFEKLAENLAVLSDDVERMKGMLERATKDNFQANASRLLKYFDGVFDKLRTISDRFHTMMELVGSVERLLLTSKSFKIVMMGKEAKENGSDWFSPHLSSLYGNIVADTVRRVKEWRNEFEKRLNEI